jgi:hypothetical protein
MGVYPGILFLGLQVSMKCLYYMINIFMKCKCTLLSHLHQFLLQHVFIACITSRVVLDNMPRLYTQVRDPDRADDFFPCLSLYFFLFFYLSTPCIVGSTRGPMCVCLDRHTASRLRTETVAFKLSLHQDLIATPPLLHPQTVHYLVLKRQIPQVLSSLVSTSIGPVANGSFRSRMASGTSLSLSSSPKTRFTMKCWNAMVKICKIDRARQSSVVLRHISTCLPARTTLVINRAPIKTLLRQHVGCLYAVNAELS